MADAITCSRVLLCCLLLFFQPSSYPFAACYLLCGITDVLDGIAARKLHTESTRGAILDSAADLCFAAVYAVRILPCRSIPLWIWIWTAAIAAAKVTGIVIASMRMHRFRIVHSFWNKLTGLSLFLLPFCVHVFDIRYGAVAVCVIATAATADEFWMLIRKNNLCEELKNDTDRTDNGI